MHAPAYKVVVVEDELLILDDIIEKIEKTDSAFKVVGSAYNGKSGLSLIKSEQPDILFTDIRMPMMDGLELIRQVKDEFPEMHIVILSGYDEFDYAKQAIRLGVKDYLIKPLLMEDLTETLMSIKSVLDSRFLKTEREIVYSEISGMPSGSTLPSTLKNSFFCLFLITVGHLCNPIASFSQLNFFKNCWSGLDWSSILSVILTSDEKWWVVDEKQPNQKFLIFATPNSIHDDFSKIAQHLSDRLKDTFAPLPVNICMGANTIPYSQIWSSAQKARLFIDQNLVLGKSLIYLSGLSNSNESPRPNMENIILNRISFLLQSNNSSSLRKELFSLLDNWNQKSYPQRRIEKNLHHLIRLFQHQVPSISDAEVCHLEYLLSDLLSTSVDLRSIYPDIWSVFGSFIQSDVKENEDTKEIIDHIEEYIRTNYADNINLEEIARKFSIDFSYLSKAFKKYKSVTPLKFLITLRILEAKRLMGTQPELDIKEIGEIIGYTDQHYFSRIFKNVTGKAPSEYKKLLTTAYFVCLDKDSL
jgi:two-component system, response regulator YesN